MKISKWRKDKNLSVIKHNSPQGDFDKIQDDLNRQENRLEAFKKSARCAVVFTAMTVFGLSPTLVAADVGSDVNVDPLHQQIRSEVTPGYEQFQEMAGTDNLTIIDKNDPNLLNIIKVSDIRVLPDLTYHYRTQIDRSLPEQMIHDIANIFKSNDAIKRSAAEEILTSDPKTYAVAQGTREVKGDLGRLCFMQAGSANFFEANTGLMFSFSDIEVKAGVAIHELAHCQDLSDTDYFGSVQKQEILADVTASLLIASHTGNWDYATHSIGALRTIHQGDPEHASQHFLSELRQRVNLDDLQPLTQKEAFEMAAKEIQAMDIEEIVAKTQKEIRINKDYNRVINHDMGWDNLEWGAAGEYFSFGINGKADFNAAMEEHGNRKLETYLNHLTYKRLEDHPVMAGGALLYLGKHATAFNDPVMHALVIDQLQHFDEHQSLDLEKIEKELGYNLDFEARDRFFDNMKTMRPVFLSYQPQTRSNSDMAQLPVNPDAHASFMKSLKLDGSNHRHDPRTDRGPNFN